VSRDVTFNEQESYFKEFHLHGENIRKGDELLIEDELLILPRKPKINPITATIPAIKLETKATPTETQLESRTQLEIKPQPETNIDSGSKIGKNLVYSKKKNEGHSSFYSCSRVQSNATT